MMFTNDILAEWFVDWNVDTISECESAIFESFPSRLLGVDRNSDRLVEIVSRTMDLSMEWDGGEVMGDCTKRNG